MIVSAPYAHVDTAREVARRLSAMGPTPRFVARDTSGYVVTDERPESGRVIAHYRDGHEVTP